MYPRGTLNFSAFQREYHRDKGGVGRRGGDVSARGNLFWRARLVVFELVIDFEPFEVIGVGWRTVKPLCARAMSNRIEFLTSYPEKQHNLLRIMPIFIRIQPEN